jgi:pyruvate dehydrogenase E2 component (dihydrolipoamide acetyltransferase)|tara:strand:+ start:8753 stop:10021 length:1269 start_codon:yes stop_codon:yes gene_type:complete
MSNKTLNIPDLGEVEDAEVIEVCVNVGERVDSEDSIVIIESDKAAMDIPASISGRILSIKLSVGDKVNSGTPFLEIEADEEIVIMGEVSSSIETETNKQHDKTQLAPAPLADSTNKNTAKIKTSNGSSVYAGPAVRKLAREFGIQLSLVNPSGPRGRIQKEDLHTFVKGRLSDNANFQFQFTQPEIDYSKWGLTEEQKLTKFQKSSLTNLHTSWINIPHVTQHDECDLSILMELRAKLNKKHKTKISPLAFISKITATLLYEFPLLNSSLDHNLDNIIVKKYVNLGIAVDTPEGLIVPNIKNIENKSISVISEEIKLLAESAKTRKLKLSDLKGASFTISSLGAIGGKFFTPIINPPEVAILGLSKTFQKIIPESKSFKTRDFLPLSLSYDHRVINGVYAVQFTTQLGEALSDVKLIEKSFK